MDNVIQPMSPSFHDSDGVFDNETLFSIYQELQEKIALPMMFLSENTIGNMEDITHVHGGDGGLDKESLFFIYLKLQELEQEDTLVQLSPNLSSLSENFTPKVLPLLSSENTTTQFLLCCRQKRTSLMYNRASKIKKECQQGIISTSFMVVMMASTSYYFRCTQSCNKTLPHRSCFCLRTSSPTMFIRASKINFQCNITLLAGTTLMIIPPNTVS